MADKRIKDLDSTTLGLNRIIAVDQTELSEAEQCTIAEFYTFTNGQYIYTGNFVTGDTTGTPNWSITIVHDLSTSTPTVTLWNSGGYEQSTIGVVQIVNSNSLTLSLKHAITGTWTYKISKF